MRNLFALGLLLAACTAPDDLRTSNTAQQATVYNGPQMNGVLVNGFLVNGFLVNGVLVNGVLVNGVLVNGTVSNGVLVNGILVNGPRLGDHELDNLRIENGRIIGEGVEDLTGLIMETVAGDKDAPETQKIIRLRVDAVEHAEGFDSYAISYSIVNPNVTEETWSPICGTRDDGTPRVAIPDVGLWDYRSGVPGGGARIPGSEEEGHVTLACEGGALYKCMNMGYLPWEGDDFRSLHQACVRMVRLDMCGDGQAWTMEGTMLHVHDGLAIQADTSAELEGDWQPEAGWTPDGAQWIAGMRVS